MARCFIGTESTSGTELSRRLISDRRQLPIISIAAMDCSDALKDAMDAGCIAHLYQPFPAKLLMDAIEKVLRNEE